MVYDQIDHAEDIFFEETFVLLAVKSSCSLACYLGVFVVPSFESFANDFLELLFRVF